MARLILSEGQAKNALERVVERVLEGEGINPRLVDDWSLESDGSTVRLKAEVLFAMPVEDFQALLEREAGHG